MNFKQGSGLRSVSLSEVCEDLRPFSHRAFLPAASTASALPARRRVLHPQIYSRSTWARAAGYQRCGGQPAEGMGAARLSGMMGESGGVPGAQAPPGLRILVSDLLCCLLPLGPAQRASAPALVPAAVSEGCHGALGHGGCAMPNAPRKATGVLPGCRS